MSFAAARGRGEIAAGAALGMCAALIAISPGIAIKAAACAAPMAILGLWWMLREPARWLALFFVSALLLPPLPIDLGNAGPHVALLFAGCGLLIGLIHRVPLHLDGLGMSLCALFAAMAASVSMAAIYSGLPIAAASMARVMLFGISVYVFFFVRGARVSFHIVRVLFWVAAGSAVFACLDFYFQFPAPAGYGPQFIWLDSGVFRRAQGVFYEASTLGNLCAFFLEMIAVALFRPRRERPVSMGTMLTGGVALASALVLSYSRASLVNLGVALAVLLWLHRNRVRLGRFLLAAGVLGGTALAMLFGLFPLFARAYWQRIGASFSYFSEAPNAILSGRVDTWTLLTQYLIAHPWHAILGIGYKTLPYSDFIGQTSVADNTYLGLLLETGIAGFAALLIWNVAVIRASYRAAQSDDSERSFCGTWMLCFWAGQIVQMFSGDLLTYWRVLPVYTCVLALAVRRK
ncbi:MAG: O-antigen ligase family protein [Bryobacteraceae bacterium]